jgi:hypothetical protein
MRQSALVGVGVAGVAVGMLGTLFFGGQPRPARAASNDRYQDYVMSTGAVTINPRIQTDGVWLLDYKSGKLLGTVIDKTQGKIVGFAEVDLATEFGVEPRQDVHFLMTTGYVTQGQSALYVAETTTGKFGVYTMGPGANGNNIVIRRHDMTSFRQAAATPDAKLPPGGDPAAGLPAGVPIVSPQGLPPTPAVPGLGTPIGVK